MWELRTLLEDQPLEYNRYRPHSSTGYLTPVEFARRRRENTRLTSQGVGPSINVAGRLMWTDEANDCRRQELHKRAITITDSITSRPRSSPQQHDPRRSAGRGSGNHFDQY
jgi:hypothetical protein